MTKEDNCMPMWVLYDHPSDYPDDFVLVKYKICRATDVPSRVGVVFKGDTHEEATDFMDKENPGRFFIPRHEKDDPCVVGVFV